jgi:hypothetical protein
MKFRTRSFDGMISCFRGLGTELSVGASLVAALDAIGASGRPEGMSPVHRRPPDQFGLFGSRSPTPISLWVAPDQPGA